MDKISESAPSEPGDDDLSVTDLELPHIPPARVQRRGKAPPIDAFTGENPELTVDDWLPSLKRTATWNKWSESETVLQLAGHLRSRA